MISQLQISFIIASTIMLLWESVIQSVANYSFNELISFLHPIIAFGGLAVGNVIGLTTTKFVKRADWSIFLALSIGLSWLGIFGLPELGLIWLFLPFIPMGALFYDYFSSINLRSLLIGSSLVGIFYFSFLWTTGSATNSNLLLVLLLLSCLLATIHNFQYKKIALIACIGLVPVVLKIFIGLELESHMARRQSSFDGAVSIGKPEIFCAMIVFTFLG